MDDRTAYYKCVWLSDKRCLSMRKSIILGLLEWANKHSPFNLFNGAGKLALDVGCGVGFLSNILERLGYTVIGLDVSRILSTAKRLYAIECIRSDAHNIPVGNEKIDLVILFDVIEHFGRAVNALSSIYCSLKHGGIMVILTPNGIMRPITDAIGKLLRTGPDSTHIDVKPSFIWEREIRHNMPLARVTADCSVNIPKFRLVNFRDIALFSPRTMIKMPMVGPNTRIVIVRP